MCQSDPGRARPAPARADWMVAGDVLAGLSHEPSTLASLGSNGRRLGRLGRGMPALLGRRRLLLRLPGGFRRPLFGRRRAYGRSGAALWRKKRERVHVALLVRGDSDAQMNVGGPEVRLPGRPHHADDRAFLHTRAAGHGERPEMNQGGRVAVARSNGDCEPAAGNRAGERDRSGCRGNHPLADGGSHVDAAMLAPGVRVAAIECKWSQHRPIHGPGPGERGRHADLERKEDRKQGQDASHACSSSLSQLETNGDRSKPVGCCQSRLQRRAVQLVARKAGESRHDVDGAPSWHARGHEVRDGGDGVLP
jgi:hypothetical protein